MKIEFKEKTYEKYFSQEIGRLTNISFSPDQCDESFLGFDDAFFLPLRHLNFIAPYVRRSRRSHRIGIFLKELEHLTDEVIRRMPPFRFNLFVQYKRPEYLLTKGAKEWHFWQRSYYRFDITPHQQKLLERLEAISYDRASTVYASPAFWSASDLWQHVAASHIIDKSNIASAGRLVSHGCYTYVEPGHRGRGHSESVAIDSPILIETISAGVEKNDPLEAKQHLLKTAETMRSAANENEYTKQLLKQAEFPYLSDEAAPSQLMLALTTLRAFSDAFDISTFMLG
jgi:hypothetical protein